MTAGWQSVRDGMWATSRGDTINKVNPRGGLTLYALRVIGSRRPEWHNTLGEAKKSLLQTKEVR